VNLNCTVSSFVKNKGKYRAVVEIENPSASLAFSVNPKILKQNSKNMVLPVYWEDNYFSLLPKEKKTVAVEFNPADLNDEMPVLVIDGWNISHSEKELK
jgi:exo-1,4-beta-D-glucosaminidase